MTDIKKKGFSNAAKDLIIILLAVILVFILSYFLNVFVFLVDLFRKSPRWITYIDEIITVLLTLSIGAAVFAWRRWRELRRETAERIKLQEELIKCATTKAETEHIIAKQLRSDIE